MCEGYTDVIGCFQAGVPWAVATCGTALAEEHFTLLRNFAKRIVLAYDADAAGQSATSACLRVGAQARGRRRGGRSARWQRPGRPGAHRPRRAGHGDPEARPFLQFRVDRMLGTGNLSTAEGRARAAEAALTAVAEHPDDLVRDQYVMQLADRCRVDAAKLRERLEYLRAHPPAESPPGRRRRPSRGDEPPPGEYPEDDGDRFGPDDGRRGAPRPQRCDLGLDSRRSSWRCTGPKM